MMGMHPKRLTAVLLAFIMSLSAMTALSSCGDSLDGTETGTVAEEGTTVEEDTRAAYDTVEKTAFNRDFSILGREELENDFYVESFGADENGFLDDAIYTRNKVVENDYKINITCVFPSGDYTKVNELIQLQVSGGLDDYDMAIGHKYSFTTCAQNNYLLDLGSIDSINLENVWWDSACLENLTVDGKTYMMVGDILPSSMLISACFVFNKKMMNELGKEEPYGLVTSGDWTLDAFNAMTADVTMDKNGDGTIRYQDDIFGLTTWVYDAPYSMFYGAGGKFVIIDPDTRMPSLQYDTETVFNIYSKLYEATITNQAYQVTDVTYYKTNYDVFTEGRALFCDITLNKISTFLSDMKEDYGIVPVPKYDQFQKEYLSFVNGSSGFVMVINTEKDTDFVGTIIEAMGAYNYDQVSPNMFEIVTKIKSARDPQSSDMVDYIIRNRIYDFGYFYDLSITNVVRDQLIAGKQEISSPLRTADRSSKNTLNKIIEALEKNT